MVVLSKISGPGRTMGETHTGGLRSTKRKELKRLAAEFAMLAVLIAVALVGALTLFGIQLSAIWQSIADCPPALEPVTDPRR